MISEGPVRRPRLDPREVRYVFARPEDFDRPQGVKIVAMDLTTGRRGAGPCTRVIQEAFVEGTEPDKDCSGQTVAVSKLPFYMQRQFYQPKESEPTQASPDASAQSGESAESPAPDVPANTTTTTTAKPPGG